MEVIFLVFAVLAAIVLFRAVLRGVARRPILAITLLIAGIAGMSAPSRGYPVGVGIGGLACLIVGVLALFVQFLAALGPLGSILLIVLVGETFDLDLDSGDEDIGGLDLDDDGADATEGPNSVIPEDPGFIASTGGVPFALPNNVLESVLGPGALGPLPGIDGFGEPSELDGDPRVHPVRGHFREVDGELRWIHPYWRGAQN